jgi:release factor glutamine methyltransferase
MKAVSDQDSAAWTIARLLSWTSDYFNSHGIDSPRLTAELLLSHSLSIKRLDLYLQHDKPLSQEELACFKSLIKRRVDREPVAYITGTKGFWTLDLIVTPDVLIPRPDTECLVESAIQVLPITNENSPLNILDLGTGSGAIILSIASERPCNRYFAVDISDKAVHIARKNRDSNNIKAPVSFILGQWFGPFAKRQIFDLIVSNPPYIPSADIAHLEPEITRYEPMIALDGDTDGLSCIRSVLEEASFYLKDGGYLMMETGFDQKPAVTEIAEKCGCYEKIEYIRDGAGHDRVVKMRKRQPPGNRNF